MKIIALVDGSIYSKSVCDLAAWAAQRTGASVDILHVLGRRDGVERADLSGSIRLGARSALLEELAALDEARAKLVAHRGRAILDDAKAVLTDAGVVQVAALLRHGDLLDSVAEREGDADLIVIGKRGEAADFAKGHLGSNLERIVRRMKRPVMVAARAFSRIGKVLVAYDGGASAMRAVDHIARNPLFAGLEVTVVTVGAPNPALQKGLADAEAVLRAGGLRVEIKIAPGQPETALAKLVDEDGFDLLVMGAYGHSRIRSLIIGSTTTEMIRSCKIPVLLIR